MPVSKSSQNRLITAWWPTGAAMAFYVRVNMGNIPVAQIPLPGTTYANSPAYVDKSQSTGLENFEFIVDQDDAEDGWRQYHYAAPLMTSAGGTISGQESYNYEVFNTGEYEFPRCVQTWLIKRGTYDPDLLTAAPPSFAKPYSWTRTNSRQLRCATAFHQRHQLMDSLYVIYEVTWIDISTVLTGYEPDPETRDNITITRQLTTTSGAPTQAAGSEITKTSVKPGLWLVTTRTIGSGTPTGYTQPDIVEFEFPALLTGITMAAVTALNGQTAYKVNANLSRSAYRRAAQGKMVVDYFPYLSPPALDTPFLIQPRDLVYSGFLFSLGIHNVITDGNTITATAGTDDPIWGLLNESYTWASSTPSLTAYNAAIGTYVLIVEKYERWHFGCGRRTKISILLE